MKFVELYESGQNLFIILEFMDKGSLNNTISKPQNTSLISVHHRNLSEDACRYILYNVVKGLYKMHEKDLLHRDIKPDNVLISSDGYVKLCDLGIAIFLSDE